MAANPANSLRNAKLCSSMNWHPPAVGVKLRQIAGELSWHIHMITPFASRMLWRKQSAYARNAAQGLLSCANEY